MTDPTPQTTPTRDEAVPTGWKLVPVEPTIEMLASQTGYTIEGLRQEPLRQRDLKLKYAAMLASAPAPASGGVDAVAKLLQEIYRLTDKESERAEHAVRQRPSIRPVTNARRMHCADRVNCLAQEALAALASLSPAATPMSEAEPVAWRWRSRMKGGQWDAWEQGRYGAEVPPFMEVEEQYALAKPASSPAGGDEIARWKRDSELLSAIQDECWDVRFTNSPNADAGDYNVNIEIVGHFMADPQERVVGENYNEDLRAALEQAMTAEPYPPARPIYDEPDEPEDAALSQSTSAGRVGG